MPTPPSIPAAPPLPPPEPQSWSDRLIRRLLLEALALTISFAWLPILGLYGLMFIVAVALLQDATGTTQLSAIAAQFASLPYAPLLADWLGLEKEYHGGIGSLVSFGLVVSKVIFILYLVTLPIRLAVPRRLHPGFRGRALLLALLSLGLAGFLAFTLRSAKFGPGTGYWGMVAVLTFFCGLCFVLSLVILALGDEVEDALTRRIDPSARPLTDPARQ